MRLITLIRHAKAEAPHPSGSDFGRPLSRGGTFDAKSLAANLANEFERPARLYSSPALRALSTARIFAAAMGIDESSIIQLPAIYEATAAGLLGMFQGFDNACVHAIAFGHNPGLSDFAMLLAECPFSDLPPCGIVTLRVAARYWDDLAPSCGGLMRYRYPIE